jgi:capsular exopolysaccharide synthesis family protein
VITVLVRGWRFVVGLPVGFGLIALVVSLLQTPLYEASSTLYVTSGGISQGPALPYEAVMGAAGRVTSYARLAYTDEVLVGALKTTGLSMTVNQARSAVRSVMVPESVMLTVSAKDSSPEVALRLTNAVAHSMIDTVAALEVPQGGGLPSSRLTMVSPATLNTDPVSPATPANVALAVLGGLLLGVGVALIRERLNNTVRDEQDLAKAVGVRPIGHIPHDEVLGAALIIDFGASGTAAAGAFRHLRTALSVARSQRSVVTIMVTSPREGEGKSTIALNLAAAFAESGSAVVVVDADLGNHTVTTRAGNGEVPGLADAIHSQVAPLQLSAVEDMKVISAGRTRNNDPADLLASNACGTFFKQLGESFDYVIVDSPALFNGPETEAAARWADAVLLVARRGRSKMSDCYGAVTQLSDLGAELVGVVLNDVPAPKGLGRSTQVPFQPRWHRFLPSTRRTTPHNGSPRPSLPAAETNDRDH